MSPQEIVMLQKMHASAQATFDFYNGKQDKEKAQFWIGRVTALTDVLKTQNAGPDQHEVVKARVDLEKLHEAEGKELVK